MRRLSGITQVVLVTCALGAGWLVWDVASNNQPGGGDRFEQIDAYVSDQMEGARIPGISLAVVEDGVVTHSSGFGNDGHGVNRPQARAAGIVADYGYHPMTMPELRRHRYTQLMEATREVRKLEKEADAIFRQETSRLFHDPSIDVKELIRQKTLLDDIEHAIDRCEHVASTLTNLAVKHG